MFFYIAFVDKCCDSLRISTLVRACTDCWMFSDCMGLLCVVPRWYWIYDRECVCRDFLGNVQCWSVVHFQSVLQKHFPRLRTLPCPLFRLFGAALSPITWPKADLYSHSQSSNVNNRTAMRRWYARGCHGHRKPNWHFRFFRLLFFGAFPRVLPPALPGPLITHRMTPPSPCCCFKRRSNRRWQNLNERMIVSRRFQSEPRPRVRFSE